MQNLNHVAIWIKFHKCERFQYLSISEKLEEIAAISWNEEMK